METTIIGRRFTKLTGIGGSRDISDADLFKGQLIMFSDEGRVSIGKVMNWAGDLITVRQFCRPVEATTGTWTLVIKREDVLQLEHPKHSSEL